DQFRVGEVLGEQIRVTRGGAAVAADVEVPAARGGDDTEVLRLGLRALALTAGDRRLEFVRGAQPAVAQLQVDRHAYGVLDAVAAPGLPDAGLHRAQRLAVGVAGLEAGVDQAGPDEGELFDPGAEHVDPLTAGDLRVGTEV